MKVVCHSEAVHTGQKEAEANSESKQMYDNSEM